MAGIPSGSRVVPAVLSEDRLVLGASLEDGTRIRGQHRVSHPKPSDASSHESRPRRPTTAVVKSGIDSEEDRFSLHPSPVSRVAYLSHDRRRSSSPEEEWNDRDEIHPEPNPLVLDAVSNANCVVYACGSLFTSVVPSLVLKGVGDAVSKKNSKDVPKVLLLNGWHDKETCWAEPAENGVDGEIVVKRMDATMIVKAVVDALDQGRAGRVSNGDENENDGDSTRLDGVDVDDGTPSESFPLVTDYVTHVLHPIGTEIEIDERSLQEYCQRRRRMRRRQMRQRREPASPDETPAPSESDASVPSTANFDDAIVVMGVPSIPANACSEGSRSGGRSRHRIFDPRALVDVLLDLSNGGEGRVAGVHGDKKEGVDSKPVILA